MTPPAPMRDELPKKHSLAVPRLLSSMLASPRAVAGLILIGMMVVLGVGAPWLVTHPPGVQDLQLRLQPPAWQEGGDMNHLLGTDQLGRDLFSRIAYGARTSLAVAAAAVVIAGLVGTCVGLVAGLWGGLIDIVLMRAVDLVLAFPSLLLAIVLVALLRPSMESVIAVLVINGWVLHARMVRGQVLTLREREYVHAARLVGATEGRIAIRHILPNLVPVIVVVSTLQLAHFILIESALSFLGLGILPPTPSWGSILNEGRGFILTAWWIQAIPGVAIVIAVSGISFMGDWLRDYLDPRLKIGTDRAA